jgi:hypothetical protein
MLVLNIKMNRKNFSNMEFHTTIKKTNYYCMKTLSLKLEDQIFDEAEAVISKVRKTRNRYINEAVDYYNRYNKRKILATKLANESKMVQEESMYVLREFESIINED